MDTNNETMAKIGECSLILAVLCFVIIFVVAPVGFLVRELLNRIQPDIIYAIAWLALTIRISLWIVKLFNAFIKYVREKR